MITELHRPQTHTDPHGQFTAPLEKGKKNTRFQPKFRFIVKIASKIKRAQG
jgi:hypothetical protein